MAWARRLRRSCWSGLLIDGKPVRSIADLYLLDEAALLFAGADQQEDGGFAVAPRLKLEEGLADAGALWFGDSVRRERTAQLLAEELVRWMP